MSLPEITAPSSVPAFLIGAHSITDTDVFAPVPQGQGEPRRRQLTTTQLRRAAVSWMLTGAQMTTVDAWFEQALVAGAALFTARLQAEGVGMRYWAARWAGSYEATPIKTPGDIKWKVTGSLILIGDASMTPPAVSSLAMETALVIAASASIAPDNGLRLEVALRVLLSTPLAMETALVVLSISDGATPSDVDRDKRWSWMRYPYARGHTADLSDDQAARRNWMGF